MPRRRTPRWLAALAVLGPAPTACAAGFYSVDAGVRALGRGGAFAAGADDYTAQYWNPAALTRLDRPQLGVHLAGIHDLLRFDRADEDGLAFEPVTNRAPPLLAPSFGLSHGFGIDGFTATFGLYSPYGPMYRYDEDGPQRYAVIDSLLLQATLGPSVAYRFADLVSVGAGVGYAFMRVDQTVKSSVSYDPTDDPAYDSLFTIAMTDPFAIAWNAGILVEPRDGTFAIGASIVPPATFRLSGSIEGDFSENALYTGESSLGKLLAVDSVADDEVTMSVTLPMIVKSGVLVRPTERVELEVDFVYQAWSSVDQFVITGVDLVAETTKEEDMVVTEDIALPARMQDAWSVRAGTEIGAGEAADLRGGLFFESSAAPEESRSVFVPDAPKIGYGLGATWRIKDRLALDAGWSQAFGLKSDITGSLVYQVRVDPLSGDVEGGKTVGNGELGFVTSILGVGLTWHLGPAPRPPAEGPL